MKKTCLRLLLTLLITYAYCIIWVLLEYFFFGGVENRGIDNIMMTLFIPVIYLATEPLMRMIHVVLALERKGNNNNVAPDASNSGVNPMCLRCSLFQLSCKGTSNMAWTGCIYKK